MAAAQIEQLALAFAARTTVPAEYDLAQLAAEAHIEIMRARRAKVDLFNRAAGHFRDEDARSLPAGERAALAFAQKTKTLAAFDR